MINTFRLGYYRSFHSIEVDPLVQLDPGIQPFTPGERTGSMEVRTLSTGGGGTGQLFWRPGTPLAQRLFGQWDLLFANANSSYHSLRAEFETRICRT